MEIHDQIKNDARPYLNQILGDGKPEVEMTVCEDVIRDGPNIIAYLDQISTACRENGYTLNEVKPHEIRKNVCIMKFKKL